MTPPDLCLGLVIRSEPVCNLTQLAYLYTNFYPAEFFDLSTPISVFHSLSILP